MSPQQRGRASHPAARDRVPQDNNMYATVVDVTVEIAISAVGILTPRPFGLTIAAVAVCS